MSSIAKVSIDMKKLGGFNIKVVNTLSKEDRDSGKESIIAGSGRVVYTKDNLITAIPFKAN